jgi:hypothetical protein
MNHQLISHTTESEKWSLIETTCVRENIVANLVAFIEWIEIQQTFQYILFELVSLFVLAIGYYVANDKVATSCHFICVYA